MGFLKIKGPAAWSLVRTQPGPLKTYTQFKTFQNLTEKELPIFRKFCFFLRDKLLILTKLKGHFDIFPGSRLHFKLAYFLSGYHPMRFRPHFILDYSGE